MRRMSFLRPRQILPCVCLAAMLLVAPRPTRAADATLSGEAIFTAKCVRCHGPHGEGTKDHEDRLEGDLSVAQLAEVIAETMPDDDPGTVTADEAQVVAAYIHDAFYSAIAAARNRPARIALARLTVRQYRRAVADLIGSFREPAEWGDERGLRGTYFNSREPDKPKDRVARRIDPLINFDFGTEAPVPGIDDPRAYSIRWVGSVLAPETGNYEFAVRTEHAARLWINDDDVPLMDAWVKSGEGTEYKANLYVVAGRVYPLRLEFSKAKLMFKNANEEEKKQEEKRKREAEVKKKAQAQKSAVEKKEDEEKKKQEEKAEPPSPPGSIALLWQRPNGAAEPIPTRFLSPDRVPESFVCSVPFPPDDRSYGWERGTAVSAAWDEATTAAAIQAAGYVIDHLDELAGTPHNPANRPKRLRTFCRRFARRAFRRPLDDELVRTYIDSQFDETEDADTVVRRVVLLILKSPRFLFREVDGGSDPYNTAARLSFGLWDSIPDQDLLAAARDGELDTDEQVRQQAERMLTDLRARTKLRSFLLTWLNVDGEVDLSKDPEKFPNFDAAAIADLRASLELFLDEVVWSEASDYRELLLSNEVYLNNQLAKLYGLPFSSESGSNPPSTFTKSKLDDNNRAGVLTHPYIMARFSHRGETSPIHRGVFLARGILGQSLRPPPEAFTPLAPELHPDLTTRERVTLQTRDAACMSCHHIINPLGFTLERFDAVGRYRESDSGKPIDATTEYQAPGGMTTRLNGARDLAEYLAHSDECHAAFVEQLFHHLVQQPVQAYGPTTLDDLRRSFTEHNFNIRHLAIEIMVATARKGRETNKIDLTKELNH
jgi:cytochrome c553